MADITVHEAEHGGHDAAAHNENLKFAMWLYLTSEVVIFSMLIAGYAIFRATQVSSVNLVKDALGIGLVTANTFVLLISSYAMVMGLRAIRMGNRQGFYRWIAVTALLGTVFLAGQYVEYSELGHLGISLDKQDFTVDTNIFETVNHVEAVASDVRSWTYDADEQAFVAGEVKAIYTAENLAEIQQFESVQDIPEDLANATVLLPAGTSDEDIQTIPNAATRNLTILVGSFYPIEDLREVHRYENVQDIPASLANATVLLPAGTAAADIESIPAERNLNIIVGDITTYHVDFEEDAELFRDINLTETAINENTRGTIEPLLIDWNDDFILLNAEGAATADADIEAARLEIDNSLETLDIRQLNRVPLSRLAVQTTDGEIVPFNAIIAGQAVDLDQDQYDNLNAYFRALIGDSASGYGMRFYAPTAFHGAHVFIGVLWALFVLWRGYQGAYDKNAIGLELFGLYWHFVDVVWIVLFTLIYLV